MNETLHQLLIDGIIDEVVSRLKSGKEADVWLVHHEGELVAAKIYKERSTRSFKNNAGYVEGRRVRSSRTQRAIDKGTRFGQEAAEEAWKSAEADSLYRLHAAGVRVPTPKLFYEGVLLMELLLGQDGGPAPRLIECAISPEEARAMYEDLRSQVVQMLCCDLIHGDLSPYNVLLAAGGPTIIDFPQTVAAASNSQAAFYFKRDLENLRTFFAGFDRSLRKEKTDANEIWAAYERRELTPDFVPTGRYEPAPKPVTAASTLQEMLRELAEEERESRRGQRKRGKRGGRGETEAAGGRAAEADHRPSPRTEEAKGGEGAAGRQRESRRGQPPQREQRQEQQQQTQGPKEPGGGGGQQRRRRRRPRRKQGEGQREAQRRQDASASNESRRPEPAPRPAPRKEAAEPVVVHVRRLGPGAEAGPRNGSKPARPQRPAARSIRPR